MRPICVDGERFVRFHPGPVDGCISRRIDDHYRSVVLEHARDSFAISNIHVGMREPNHLESAWRRSVKEFVTDLTRRTKHKNGIHCKLMSPRMPRLTPNRVVRCHSRGAALDLKSTRLNSSHLGT